MFRTVAGHRRAMTHTSHLKTPEPHTSPVPDGDVRKALTLRTCQQPALRRPPLSGYLSPQ